MEKIEWKNTEDLVGRVLHTYPFTRNSDHLLDAMIVQILGYGNYNYIDVMNNRKKYNIPSFATIERCRRKLQASHKNLKADKEVQDVRFEMQNEYENYALDKVLL